MKNKVFLAAICGVMLLHTTVVAAAIQPLSKNSASSVVRGQRSASFIWNQTFVLKNADATQKILEQAFELQKKLYAEDIEMYIAASVNDDALQSAARDAGLAQDAALLTARKAATNFTITIEAYTLKGLINDVMRAKDHKAWKDFMTQNATGDALVKVDEAWDRLISFEEKEG